MASTVTLGVATLDRMMAIVQSLGAGDDLDDVLELIARAVVDVIGFDAVAVNVATSSGELQVRTVVGPPELQEILGGTLANDRWVELLDSGERWGQLRFLRAPELDDEVPHVDPWRERLDAAAHAPADPTTELWQPEFALLVPMWRGPAQLHGVISVDLPRSGRTPTFEQRALLELFGSQACAAIARLDAFDRANDDTSLYRAAFASSPAPTVVLDGEFLVRDVNTAFVELADAVAGELTGRPLGDLFGLGDIRQLTTELSTLRTGRAMLLAEECELRHPRGQQWERWVRVEARRVDGVASGPGYVCSVTDRTELRGSLLALRRRADFDDLTGLKSRAVGLRRLEQLCSAATEAGVVTAVLYCDLDNFKAVNDSAGHLVGDDTLVSVAGVLEACCDESDTVCRWGGDEFVVLAQRANAHHVVELANRLVEGVRELARAMSEADPRHRLDLSIGVAELAAPGDPVVVLERADAALYRAKSDPHRRVHVELL